jgi:predicted CoA-substrate-specific enzyme activase
MFQVGIDIGSTTIKCVVLNDEKKIIYKDYMRHKSSITKSLINLISGIEVDFANEEMYFNFTGSAGMLLAEQIEIQFTQEVVSATVAIRKQDKHIDCCIELGGEDAKIIFFDGNNIEQRMNGTCAGGTGSFIDQMSTLLAIDVIQLNELAKNYEKIYPIASRCGVFAKSDIQSLLNQGANHNDIAVSIYQAIVNQTIAGLSQGHKIKGNVAFLGGPLTFSSELRKRFVESLKLEDYFVPKNGEVFVAYGAALNANTSLVSVLELKNRVIAYDNSDHRKVKKTLKPLFTNRQELDAFTKRHSVAKVEEIDLGTYVGNAYLGIDAGSTTTKLVLLSENNKILYQYYSNNKGNPVDIVKKAIYQIYDKKNDETNIVGSYSTGYGEELIKHAFNLDGSEVETICHYKAASYFNKDVDFIIDIGGQDMKCFKISNGIISSIILNEACSSGCGSFLDTFSASLGYTIKEFAALALESDEPVDLGSRCTVFMNSGVKQAQAEGAKTENISAGLAYSVVKNALYKVIRTVNAKQDLGKNIIVQGGTFYNSAVLRAFEQEIDMYVVRPNISGLMGAFGAALLAKENIKPKTKFLSKQDLDDFTYVSKKATCKKCSNFCGLTLNIFNDSKYISGNRCEKGAGINTKKNKIPNLYLYKYEKILKYKSSKDKVYKAKIGIPLVMNMYENIPFWFTFFDTLDMEVIYSDLSSKAVYELGQDSIPSDTACYPAKIAHGHIETLINKKQDKIFYPNMPFNFIEKTYRDNEYNCPVVAFYPEVIGANMENLDLKKFLKPYLSLNKKKYFLQNLLASFEHGNSIPIHQAAKAYDKAIKAYNEYREDVLNQGQIALKYAKDNNKNIILLAGRPYHVDPEINHGIPKLLQSLDVVVLSEDSVNSLADQDTVKVLNQWTYHTRLYDSAKFISTVPNANLIQLISFGCGLDAITSDEVKDILEANGKIYTGIKIDEASNLGTANIRIRSLLSTMKGVK